MKLISVVGARPNFMKIAPFVHAIEKHNRQSEDKIEHILVHTGQHYDDRMSRNFFQVLNIPEADINLGIGSGTHAEQVGQTMIAFEKVLQKEKPDWVVVVGDVNAICAASITAKKEHVKCAHIEAGLRSFDRTMPEEINRVVADSLSDLHFTPDRIANQNLLNEGIPAEKIKFVGNIMIDTLDAHYHRAAELNLDEVVRNNLYFPDYEHARLEMERFVLLTMHRPSNVDDEQTLKPIIDFFTSKVSRDLNIVWPVHPRTEKYLRAFNLWDELVDNPNIFLLYPVGYLEMLKLNMCAKLTFTDSGGLQEESTVLGTPCITLRFNTERPVTLLENEGVSVLVGNEIDKIARTYNDLIKKPRHAVRPELWDGATAERIVETLSMFKNQSL